MLGDSRKYNEKCVCQICTCGKHACPKAKLPFEGETTHNHDYRPYDVTPEKRAPCVHEYQARHYDPAALKTSYDSDYKPLQIENQRTQNKYQYKPRSGKFYGQTQYSNKYVKKDITPEKSNYCVHEYRRNPAKFEGTTTYDAEFKPKTAEKQYNASNFKYERRKVPFEGGTTYGADYKPYSVEPGQNPECRHVCQCGPRNRSRFQGESHYKSNYKPYEIEHENQCPILRMPQYPRQCSPGKRHVNYSAEKNKWQ